MKHHSSFLIKHVIAKDANRDDFELLYSTVTDSLVRPHILDIMVSITRGGPNILSIVYLDDKIVGCSSYYLKNANRFDSTCSLYNIFSLVTGAGSAAFSAYWDYTYNNSRWYKFYAFKKAHEFYSKRNFKYFGASKTGQTFSSFGRVYSNNVNLSNLTWHTSYTKLIDLDLKYFESNYKIFSDKNIVGITKIKDPYKTHLTDNLLVYSLPQLFDLSGFEE